MSDMKNQEQIESKVEFIIATHLNGGDVQAEIFDSGIEFIVNGELITFIGADAGRAFLYMLQEHI